MGVGAEDRERIGWRDIGVAAQDHVAVAVAVRRGSEVRRIRRHHEVEQVLGVGRIGVGVMPAEVGQRRAVDHRASAGFQLVLEDHMRVRPGHRVQAIETHPETRGEQSADGVEVEQRLHQREILRDGIDDLDLHPLDLDGPEAVDVDVRGVGDCVGGDRLGMAEDRLGDVLRGRSAGADVVLDAEIAVRAAGIVARRQNDPAIGGEGANQRRDGGRRKDSALADDNSPEAVRRGDLDHDLDRLPVEKAPVAAEDERFALKALEGIESRLNEVFEVVRPLKDRDLLAQTRRAWPLVGERLGGDRSGSSAFSQKAIGLYERGVKPL